VQPKSGAHRAGIDLARITPKTMGEICLSQTDRRTPQFYILGDSAIGQVFGETDGRRPIRENFVPAIGL